MNRLANIYKNDPAKLEAMNLTAQIVLEAVKGQNALMEAGTAATGTVDKLSGSQGKETVSSDHEVGNKYGSAGATDKLNSPKPTVRALMVAKDMMRKWAKSDPVACRKWVENYLSKDWDSAASIKYSNTSDDWKRSFDDEVSGQLDKDTKKINEKLAADKRKQEQSDLKAGEKAAKQQEKDFWANQKKLDKENKHQYHQNKIKEMDDAEAARLAERERLQREGKNPDMYRDTKNPGLFGKLANKAKRFWHSLHEAAEQAIADGDMTRLQSIKQQMIDFKTLCESAGLNFEAAIMD